MGFILTTILKPKSPKLAIKINIPVEEKAEARVANQSLTFVCYLVFWRSRRILDAKGLQKRLQLESAVLRNLRELCFLSAFNI